MGGQREIDIEEAYRDGVGKEILRQASYVGTKELNLRTTISIEKTSHHGKTRVGEELPVAFRGSQLDVSIELRRNEALERIDADVALGITGSAQHREREGGGPAPITADFHDGARELSPLPERIEICVQTFRL